MAGSERRLETETTIGAEVFVAPKEGPALVGDTSFEAPVVGFIIHGVGPVVGLLRELETVLRGGVVGERAFAGERDAGGGAGVSARVVEVEQIGIAGDGQIEPGLPLQMQ